MNSAIIIRPNIMFHCYYSHHCSLGNAWEILLRATYQSDGYGIVNVILWIGEIFPGKWDILGIFHHSIIWMLGMSLCIFDNLFWFSPWAYDSSPLTWLPLGHLTIFWACNFLRHVTSQWAQYIKNCDLFKSLQSTDDLWPWPNELLF